MRLKKSIILFGLLGLLVSPILTLNNQKEVIKTSAWSGTQTSTAGSYYASVGDETGSALASRLTTITAGANVDYDWPRYRAADEAEGDSNSVLLIYGRYTTPKSNSGGGTTNWNREHTYPQSKIGSTAQKDNHHIFADDNKTNGARGNMLFGEVTNGTVVKDMYGKNTDNYKNSSYFMPTPAARGEVARSTMYVNIRYGNSITGNFQSVALMLRWHIENPVTNREIYRNNTVHTLQKNRNPFIDNPDYACRIWGETNAETRNICTPQVEVPVSSVSVSPASGDIYLSSATKQLQLSASVLPSNATTKTVTWTSSNPSVASVSNTGNVTGLSAGTTTITATSTKDNTKKGSATITVINDVVAVESVSVSPSVAGISLSSAVHQLQLNETVLPSNATSKSVTWTSSAPNVATVSSTGLVTGLSVGTTTITATSTVDHTKKGSATITVSMDPVGVSGVTLSDTHVTLAKGETQTLTATVLPETAENKAVTWMTSDAGVATVNDGVVTAINSGNAIITVKTDDGDKTATTAILVVNDVPADDHLTYIFSDKDWSAEPANWTIINPALNFNRHLGLQVDGGHRATGNSPYLENISKIIIGTAATSDAIGLVGAYLVPNGSSAIETGTQIDGIIDVHNPDQMISEYELELTSAASGHIQLDIQATAGSVYIRYIKIVTAPVVDEEKPGSSLPVILITATLVTAGLAVVTFVLKKKSIF
ncbi:MAG: Ig-like domain-containing protein [Bacilli bacterium]